MNPSQKNLEFKPHDYPNKVGSAWNYPENYYEYPENEVNLLDYWKIFKKRKLQIFLVTVIGTVLALFITFLMPKKYKSEVTIMPLTESGNSDAISNVATKISSIPVVGGALGDLGKLGGGKTKELVNILKSKTLAEKVIGQLDLFKKFYSDRFDQKTNTYRSGFPAFLFPVPVMEDAIYYFRNKLVKVEEEKKSGLIKINVNMKDPVLGAKIANQMVVELQEFIENNSLTLSKRNRIFIEEQMKNKRRELLRAGGDLSQFYENNKVSSVIPQISVDIGDQLILPKPFANFSDNKGSKDTGEGEPNKNANPNSLIEVPSQVYLQYLNINQELLIKSFALLAQQYEFAKIDEAKEDFAFQVIDKAEIRVRPSSPKILLNIGLGLLGGFFLGVTLAYFLEYWEGLKKLEIIKSH